MVRTALVAVALLLTGPALAGAQPAGNRVEVNGMQMYYEVSGDGAPLIVLHGAYMNIPSMGAIIPRLAESHRVYAPELQGHGRTTDIDRPITYPNLRSEEHTSELQSLMRISYAVFCLKKKKQQNNTTQTN